MKADDFWALLRRSRSGIARRRDEIALAALTAALAELTDAAVLEFEARFRAEVDVLDRGDLRDVADQLWVLNEETWLHLRAWCVSMGPDFVASLRENSAGLRHAASPHGGPFDVPSGEIFLYCGEYARVTHEVMGAP
jgi:hypothetical protein